MIVVVSHSQDLTSDFVIRHFVEKGLKFIRLDSDTLSTPQRHFACDGTRLLLQYDGFTIPSESVSAIWARRFSRPKSISAIDSQYAQFALREIRDVMEAFIDSIHGLVVNTYEADRKAGNRLTQAIAAEKVGFEVPKTLVTQNRDLATQFAKGRNSVAKAISFGALTEDRSQVAHTTTVSADAIDGLEFCPILLQEPIPKRREWRVTTVGEKIFAARTRDDIEIDKIDWRRSADIENIFEPADLPAEIKSQLLKLCERTRIQFGAHDLIERPNGSFVFLETNPAGQWAWLELTLGMPIGKAIADLLSEQGKAR